MPAANYAIDIPIPIIQYGYFLYVWKVTTVQGDLFLYVGRTGTSVAPEMTSTPRLIRPSCASASTSPSTKRLPAGTPGLTVRVLSIRLDRARQAQAVMVTKFLSPASSSTRWPCQGAKLRAGAVV